MGLPPPKYLNEGGYVRRVINGVKQMEHRAIMEQMLGRALSANEYVHHRNGIRTDNRPVNLELWSKSQPPGQRVEDKLRWARELIQQYKHYDCAGTPASAERP